MSAASALNLSDVLARLTAIADQAGSIELPSSVASEVAGLRQRLDEPLRLVVSGRMKAGKSTLVNALVGRRAAPTQATECTKVVAWFRYDHTDRIDVVGYDGGCTPVPPTSLGGIPNDIDIDATRVERIDVWMSSRRRRQFTLIDTPGLESTSEGVSAITEAFLLDPASRGAVAAADALLYLMPHPGEHDRQFLTEFADTFAASGLGGINVVGVVSKADLLGDGRTDPMPDARRVADRYGQNLSASVERVIPLAGLVAEATEAGGFREHHTRLVARLAAADPGRVAFALRTADRFARSELEGVSLDGQERHELLSTLGTWGVRVATDAYRAGTTSTPALLAHLRERSNVDELTAVIDGPLARNASLVRTAEALDVLERALWRASSHGEPLRQQLANLRLEPVLHRLAELAALRSLDERGCRLDAQHRAEVVRVGRHQDPYDKLGCAVDTTMHGLRSVAQERARHWRGLVASARTSRTDARIADTMRRSYEIIGADVD